MFIHLIQFGGKKKKCVHLKLNQLLFPFKYIHFCIQSSKSFKDRSSLLWLNSPAPTLSDTGVHPLPCTRHTARPNQHRDKSGSVASAQLAPWSPSLLLPASSQNEWRLSAPINFLSLQSKFLLASWAIHLWSLPASPELEKMVLHALQDYLGFPSAIQDPRHLYILKQLEL